MNICEKMNVTCSGQRYQKNILINTLFLRRSSDIQGPQVGFFKILSPNAVKSPNFCMMYCKQDAVTLQKDPNWAD